jgi:hypothetical protein
LAKHIPRSANGFANVWQFWSKFAKHWQNGKTARRLPPRGRPR